MDGDLTRDDALKKGQVQAALGWLVYYKFDCELCGQRCTFEEPNKLYEYGDCFACGHKTKVEKAGFMLLGVLGGPDGRNN